MVTELIELIAFSLLPATALLVGAGYSLHEIRRLGDRRFAVIVIVLALMAIHQVQEILYFAQSAVFRDSILSELPETGVNLISAVGVYYLLAFARKQQELRNELEASQDELVDVKRRLEGIFENVRTIFTHTNRSSSTCLPRRCGPTAARSQRNCALAAATERQCQLRCRQPEPHSAALRCYS